MIPFWFFAITGMILICMSLSDKFGLIVLVIGVAFMFIAMVVGLIEDSKRSAFMLKTDDRVCGKTHFNVVLKFSECDVYQRK